MARLDVKAPIWNTLVLAADAVALTIAVDADKVSIAEFAQGACAVTLQPAPEVASGKAQEHRRSARLRTLALQRVEAFLDRVGHRPTRHFAQPFARRSQAGHVPQP
jgi:hypothetical protein